jgi:hypothetical protein
MKTLVMIGGVLAAAFGAALAVLPAQAAGQTSSPVCMAGITKGGQGRSFTIYLAQSRVSSLEGRGFSAVPCSTATESFTEFRSRACGLSQSAPPAFQQAFERIYGIGLAELCTLANEAG